MRCSENALRQKLAEAVIRMSQSPDCLLTEEELLARYLTLSDSESLSAIQKLLDRLRGTEE